MHPSFKKFFAPFIVTAFCSSVAVAQFSAYYVGHVMDTGGHPVFFATISAEHALPTYNDPTGKFIVFFYDSAFVDSQTIHPLITFKNPSYQDYVRQITISKGDSIVGPNVIMQANDSGMATVTGNAHYDDGSPVKNAGVTLFGLGYASWYNTSTNSSGIFSVKVPKGLYYVQCWTDYYVGFFRTSRMKYYDDTTSMNDARILTLSADTSGIDFTFPVLKIGTISGTVKDATTQQPIGSAWLMVSTAIPGDSSWVIADQNGHYTFQVFEGTYNVYCYQPGYFLQYYKDMYNSFDAWPITVRGDSLTATGIDFAMTKPEPGTNTITGMVWGIGGVSGPLSNVTVDAIPQDSGTWIESKTGFDGSFVFRNLKNGSYILLYSKEGYLSQFYKDVHRWEDATPFQLTGNKNVKADLVNLWTVNQFGGGISGKITVNGGSSLSSTMISAVDTSGKVVSTTFSRFGGTYALSSLGNGAYALQASKVGYNTFEQLNKISINLAQKPIVTGVDFVMDVTDVRKSDPVMPSGFSLYQNFPNPFNPTTHIQFAVPFQSIVTLDIYDLLGRKIASLMNQRKSPGTYDVQWNASRFPSGIYFYRLQAGGFIATKKLMVLK